MDPVLEALLREALREAGVASAEGEVPVGAVLMTAEGRMFTARNRTAALGRASAHAEFLAMEAAASAGGDWRLTGSVLVSTLEPCIMCAGLCVLSRVAKIVYGAPDIRFGAFGSVTDVRLMPGLNHYPLVEGPVAPEVCGNLLRDFFKATRHTVSG
ncbi:nucleoside deaminase [Candidatus Fermentibacteria bacterium]|nr:nucleoside deaminase [Candidatus Fermentibacteria bacterium]